MKCLDQSFQFGSSGTGNGQFNNAHSIALDDAGDIFVTEIVNDRVQVFDNAGNYQFQFPDVPAGEYKIVAGTDTDNDGFICDDGEACGEFITRDQPIVVEVDRDLAGLDFLVNYESPVGTLSSAGDDEIVRSPGLRRPTDPLKTVE